MSDINVTVTNAGAAGVSVSGGSTVNTAVGSGGAVNVAIGTISPGSATVVSGTVQVGKVVTLAAGSNATVANSGTSYAAVLDFGIPTGAAGSAGPTGPAGKDGVTPAFAIGTVSSLAAGSSATVTATPTNNGANVTLDFGIPRGDPGTGGGSSVSLSDGDPAALGAKAAPGTSSLASRADHIHPVPTISYANLSNVPSTFPPATHSHPYVTALNTLTGSLTLAAGSNVTITPSGSTLTIDAAGGVGPDDAVDGGEYTGYIPQNTITITTQPTAQTASNGAATFSVAATSTPGGTLSYQWEKQDGGFGNYNAVSGATSATLSLTGLLNTVDDGDKYRVVVSATNAVSVTSSAVLLTVPANVMTITSQPTNQTASGGAATFSMAATVSPSGTPTYQWQRSDDAGFSWANVAGATSATLALSDLTVEADGGSQFRAVVSAVNAASVTSNAATLTVQSNNTITITQQPSNQTASNGAATFSVAATSAPAGTPAYQWQRGALNFAAITPTQITAEEPWVNVAYGNGVFVAASSYRTAVARSSDGVTWATSGQVIGASADWRTIKYVGGLFVMPAYRSNQLPTSADGLTWNVRTLPSQGGSSGPFWNDVAYGNGVFVVINYDGLNFARSTDGVNWGSAAVGVTGKLWWAVGHGAGKFVAITTFGETTNSANGQSWSAGPNLPSLPNYSTTGRWAAMTFGKGRFVAVASNAAIAATSDDGISWTQRSLPATANWQCVSYGGGYFLALATGNLAATSQDGITWTQRTMPSSGNWAGAVFGGDRFAAVRNGSQASAAVQASWATIGGATSTTLALTGLTASNDQDQYRAIVSATNAAPVTSNAATLTVPANTITITSQPTNQTASGGAASFSVAATSSPSGTPTYQWQRSDLVPADGSTWTQRTLPTNASWNSIAYGSGQFIALGTVQSWTIIARSYDNGVTWTQQQYAPTNSVQNQLHSVAYGNGLFVALALNYDNLAVTSTDGVIWTQRTLPSYENWRSVTYGNGQFVAVPFSSNFAATSSDGITWTPRALPYSDGWGAVTYGNGVFVAMGYNNDIAATSPDGITWTQRSLPFSAIWRSATYGNGTFVAVADDASGFAATSADGVTWTQRYMPLISGQTVSWPSVTYGGGKFVAVTYGAVSATSSDGITWTQRTMPVIGGWQSVTYGGDGFVAVASGSNIAATNGPYNAPFANISGANSSTLALTGLTASNDQDQYRAVVSATNAAPVTSNAATLTVP